MRVSFIGILVEDLDDALKVYSDVLGLQPWEHGIVELPGARAVMLQVGDCYVELLQPTVGPGAPVGGDLARRLEKHGEGFCRLGLWVDDLEEHVTKLREVGVRVVDPGAYGDSAEELGAKMAFVHPKSAHGVAIELDEQT
jgi:methylmalonyl-CoA/ethylmalonyl-CoA epimerase